MPISAWWRLPRLHIGIFVPNLQVCPRPVSRRWSAPQLPQAALLMGLELN